MIHYFIEYILQIIPIGKIDSSNFQMLSFRLDEFLMVCAICNVARPAMFDQKQGFLIKWSQSADFKLNLFALLEVPV